MESSVPTARPSFGGGSGEESASGTEVELRRQSFQLHASVSTAQSSTDDQEWDESSDLNFVYLTEDESSLTNATTTENRDDYSSDQDAGESEIGHSPRRAGSAISAAVLRDTAHSSSSEVRAAIDRKVELWAQSPTKLIKQEAQRIEQRQRQEKRREIQSALQQWGADPATLQRARALESEAAPANTNHNAVADGVKIAVEEWAGSAHLMKKVEKQVKHEREEQNKRKKERVKEVVKVWSGEPTSSLRGSLDNATALPKTPKTSVSSARKMLLKKFKRKLEPMDVLMVLQECRRLHTRSAEELGCHSDLIRMAPFIENDDVLRSPRINTLRKGRTRPRLSSASLLASPWQLMLQIATRLKEAEQPYLALLHSVVDGDVKMSEEVLLQCIRELPPDARLAAVLKSLSYRILAPIINELKRILGQELPFNSVRMSWRLRVSCMDPNQVIVTHTRTEQSAPGYPSRFRFTWSAVFVLKPAAFVRRNATQATSPGGTHRTVFKTQQSVEELVPQEEPFPGIPVQTEPFPGVKVARPSFATSPGSDDYAGNNDNNNSASTPSSPEQQPHPLRLSRRKSGATKSPARSPRALKSRSGGIAAAGVPLTSSTTSAVSIDAASGNERSSEPESEESAEEAPLQRLEIVELLLRLDRMEIVGNGKREKEVAQMIQEMFQMA